MNLLNPVIFILSVAAAGLASAQPSPVAEISTIETVSKVASFTEEERKFLNEKKNITMCVDPDWMPMERINDGRHEGIAADFINIIEAYVGIPIRLVPTKSWPESIDFAKSRKCDIFSLAMPTPERLKYMSFTTPYLRLPLVLATRKEQSYVSEVSLLTDEKLGIVSGYAFAEILKRRYPEMQIIDVPSLKEGLLQVENGEIYGVVGTLASIGYLVQRGYPELKISGKFDEYWELGIGVRNDQPQLYSTIEKAVLQIDKKTAQKILNQWISVKYEQAFNYDILLKVLAVIFVIWAFFLYRQNLLKRYNKELEIKITERTRDLKLSKEKAEMANKEKSRFLANMSHELRTPMHAINSFSSLGEKKTTDDKSRDYFEKIHTSGLRLTYLLDNLLDLSKLEAGKFDVEYRKKDLCTSIHTVTDSLKSLLVEKKIEIKFPECPPCDCEYDETLIERVIMNLLSNAIKFSPSSSTIEIFTQIDQDNKIVKCSVLDEGIGIPPDEIDVIFDSFVQSSKTMTKSGGTGLGLSICKEIIDLHHGKIWAESPPKGKQTGTIFTFQIPLKPKYVQR